MWASALSLAVLVTSCFAVTITTVAEGFVWAENLWCVEPVGDLPASLFVSDTDRGDLWRVFHEQGEWHQKLHVSKGFSKFCGVTATADGTLYVLAEEEHGDCFVLQVDRAHPESYQKIAKLPRKCLGDGLAHHEATGMLYVSNEGSFIPENGKIFSVNPKTGHVEPLHYKPDQPSLTSADGAFIDQARGLLYVSEVVTSTMLVYNITDGGSYYKIDHPKGVTMLDDFTLSADGTHIYGASYGSGKVVSFPVFPSPGRYGETSARVITDTVHRPTSVRLSCKGMPDPDAIFVTEGVFTPKTPVHRVVMISDL